MSAELALISGLGIIGFLLTKFATQFEELEDTIHRGLLTLSLLFLVGIEWTAYGIAQTQGFGNAETAYIGALLITVTGFLGMTAKLVQDMMEKAGESSELESL